MQLAGVLGIAAPLLALRLVLRALVFAVRRLVADFSTHRKGLKQNVPLAR
jgi:hypothetical protein